MILKLIFWLFSPFMYSILVWLWSRKLRISEYCVWNAHWKRFDSVAIDNATTFNQMTSTPDTDFGYSEIVKYFMHTWQQLPKPILTVKTSRFVMNIVKVCYCFFFSSNFLEKILIRMLSIFNGFDEAVFQGVLISSKYFEFFHKKSTLQTIRDVIVNLHFTGKCMNWFLWLFVEEPWTTKRLKSISKQIRGIYIQTRIIYFCWNNYRCRNKTLDSNKYAVGNKKFHSFQFLETPNIGKTVVVINTAFDWQRLIAHVWFHVMHTNTESNPSKIVVITRFSNNFGQTRKVLYVWKRSRTTTFCFWREVRWRIHCLVYEI